MIKVSIIVPIYNTEKYLMECLDSIINQTLKEIEIICVDDCSTDNSFKILEEYNKKDNRIKIFQNEKNTGGPATGRNKGIDEAQGEYIYFIDADDYIENTFLENMYDTAKKYNTDIVTNLNIVRSNDNNEILSYHTDHIKGYEKYRNKKRKYLEGKSNVTIKDLKSEGRECILMYVWNKIYKRESIIKNHIKFMSYTNIKDDGAEDAHFIYQILLYGLTFSYNHVSRYYYRNTPISLSKNMTTISFFIKRIENILDSFSNNENIVYFPALFFPVLFYLFNHNLKDEYKEQEYKNLHSIISRVNFHKNAIDSVGYWTYNRYSIIKSSKDYNSYLASLNLVEKLENLVNIIAWFLPLKKWRDNLRNKVYQTRPDQTRPDQTRPE